MALSVLPSCKQTNGDTTNGQSPGSSQTTQDNSSSGQGSGSDTFQPVQINSAPTDQFAFPGQTVRFDVSASSNSTLHYQWYLNDQAISGANTASLTVSVAGGDAAGTYRVDVSNSSTSQSASATLTVGALPGISAQPQNQSVYPGDSSTFNVSASGTNIQYQWQQNVNGTWTNVSGANTNVLLITSADKSKATGYRVIVSNGGGRVVSNTATLILKDPVVITLQPSPQHVAAGQNATFHIRATGYGVLYFRWFKGKYSIYDSSKYAGTSIDTLTIKNVTSADASLYKVKVFNEDKKYVFSLAVQLSVSGPAAVTVQPEDTTLYTGKAGSLFIATTGDQPISYQWQKLNGSTWQDIGGATSATLPFPSPSKSDAGSYRCQVSNAVAQVTSSAATISVQQSASITSAPASQTVVEGNAVKFTVAAAGDNLSYEWTKNGQTLSTTGPTLSFAAVKKVDEGTYSCRVYNGGSSASCANFSLTVNSAVTITTQPTSQSTYEGGSVSLNVVASGTPTPTVEWYFGTKLVGTGPTLNLNNITTTQAGQYQCLVKNDISSVYCNAVTVDVSGSVKITQQPANTTVNEGSSLNLTVTASGDNLSYEWLKDGQDLGVNSSTLNLASVRALDEGTYSCRAWNATSSASCASFTLTVDQGVAITTQPVNATAFEDKSVTLSVAATGKPTPTVDWYFKGALVKSGSNTLALSPLTLDQAGDYQCVVKNSVDSVNCNLATVTVEQKVRITKQLSNQVLNAGDNIVLDITATGQAPLNYQCYHNGQLAVASTNPADLVIPNSSSTDIGNYYCLVSNAGSSVTSSTASINVISTQTSSILLGWSVPTHRSNGDPLSASEIAGFEIYIATSASGPFKSVLTTAGTETQATIPNLSPGDYYIGITTLDIYGLESSMSSVSKITIQ